MYNALYCAICNLHAVSLYTQNGKQIVVSCCFFCDITHFFRAVNISNSHAKCERHNLRFELYTTKFIVVGQLHELLRPACSTYVMIRSRQLNQFSMSVLVSLSTVVYIVHLLSILHLYMPFVYLFVPTQYTLRLLG